MKFPYVKIRSEPTEVFPDRKVVLKPFIQIQLWNKEKTKNSRAWALIDSGADDCIFNAKLGEMIGLNIMDAPKGKYRGIGKGFITAFFHNIFIEVGGWKRPCYAGFSYEIPMSFLGQKGFFDLYRIEFDLLKATIELKERKIT